MDLHIDNSDNDNILNVFESKCKDLITRGYDRYTAFQERINSVCEMFADESSKDLYRKEIVFCLLKAFATEDLSATYAGLMNPKKFKRAVALVYSDPCFKDPQIAKFFNELDKIYPGRLSIGKFFAYTNFVLEQYRYHDLVKVENDDVCIDAGACFGDTALYFMKHGAKKVYSFEIDKRNIEFLNRIFPELGVEGIQVVEKAVSDTDSSMWFKQNNSNIGSGGLVSLGGSYKVGVCKLDTFCKENNIIPNLIKMDIEGAEYSAIMGAKEIIQEYHPKLTICIYHSFQDRFRIPELIRSLVPEYKFYLKKSSPIYETILFCKV